MPEASYRHVMPVMLRHDYGKPERGPSTEHKFFFEALERICERVTPIWIDDYLSDVARLQKVAVDTAARERPDLVFVALFQDQLQPETLARLTEIATTLVWFGDDTWRFDEHSRVFAPVATFAASTDPFSVPRYRAIGVTPVITQWAASAVEAAAAPAAEDEMQYGVSFVGGWSPYRSWFLDFIRKQGVEVMCFGSGWKDAERIDFERMAEVFRTSRINLNISNSASKDARFMLSGVRAFNDVLRSRKTSEQIKARNFEIPLAGGFQLTNYVRGLERYFDIGAEVAAYGTPSECVEQIQYFLAEEPDRAAIARAGWQRARSEHTFDQRLTDLFEECASR